MQYSMRERIKKFALQSSDVSAVEYVLLEQDEAAALGLSRNISVKVLCIIPSRNWL